MIRLLAGKVPSGVHEAVIHHIDRSEIALGIAAELKRIRPDIRIETRTIGPTLSIHLGIGAVGIVWMNN